jgi:ATP-dependent protease Clp ATPase subunit
MGDDDRDSVCLFCGKHRADVVVMVRGPARSGSPMICDECIDLAGDVLAEYAEERAPPDPPEPVTPKPRRRGSARR